MQPRQAITLLFQGGLPIDVRGDQLHCLHCEGIMHMTDWGFICDNNLCSFRRGSPEDLLASLRGGYEAAATLCDKYGQPFNWHEAEKSRALVQFFQGLETSASYTSSSRASIRLQAQHIGLDTQHTSGAVWFLTLEEREELLDLLPGDAAAQVPPGSLIVTPLWADHHTISQLLFTDQKQRVRQVILKPCKFAWYGLPQLHPLHNKVEVWPTTRNASQRARVLSLFKPEVLASSLCTMEESESLGFIPAEVEFFCTEENWPMDLARWSHLEAHVAGQYTTIDPKTHEALNRCDYTTLLRRVCAQGFKEAGTARVFADIVSSYHLEEKHIQIVLDACSAAQRPKLVFQLERALTRRVVYRDGQSVLYAGLRGYELEKSGDCVRITNFTVELDELVHFSSRAEALLRGSISIGTFNLPFVFPEQTYSNAGAMEKSLRSAQLSTKAPENTDLATVFDRTRYKVVSRYLNHLISQVSKVAGVRYLGWSHHRDQFSSPVAITTLDRGTEIGAQFYAPEGADLQVFESADVPEATEELSAIANLPAPLAEIISIAVAGICRFFFSLPVNPIALQNSPSNRDLCEHIFAYLGQKKFFRPPVITARAFEDLRGLPCVFANVNDLQAAQLPRGGFYLYDGGLKLPKYDEGVLDQAGAALAISTHKIAEALLAGELQGFGAIRSVSRRTSYGKEGAGVLHTLGLAAWPEPGREYPLIDQALTACENTIVDHFRLDLHGNRLHILPSLWEGVAEDPDDFLLQASLLSEESQLEDGILLMDHVSGMKMLQAFYGDTPKLKRV